MFSDIYIPTFFSSFFFLLLFFASFFFSSFFFLLFFLLSSLLFHHRQRLQRKEPKGKKYEAKIKTEYSTTNKLCLEILLEKGSCTIKQNNHKKGLEKRRIGDSNSATTATTATTTNITYNNHYQNLTIRCTIK